MNKSNFILKVVQTSILCVMTSVLSSGKLNASQVGPDNGGKWTLPSSSGGKVLIPSKPLESNIANKASLLSITSEQNVLTHQDLNNIFTQVCVSETEINPACLTLNLFPKLVNSLALLLNHCSFSNTVMNFRNSKKYLKLLEACIEFNEKTNGINDRNIKIAIETILIPALNEVLEEISILIPELETPVTSPDTPDTFRMEFAEMSDLLILFMLYRVQWSQITS